MSFVTALSGLAKAGVGAMGDKLDPFYTHRKVFHMGCYGLFVVSIVMLMSWAYNGFSNNSIAFAAVIISLVSGAALFVEHHFFPSIGSRIGSAIDVGAHMTESVMAARAAQAASPYVQPLPQQYQPQQYTSSPQPPQSPRPQHSPRPQPQYQLPQDDIGPTNTPPMPEPRYNPQPGAVGGGAEGGFIQDAALAAGKVLGLVRDEVVSSVDSIQELEEHMSMIYDHYRDAAMKAPVAVRVVYREDEKRMRRDIELLNGVNAKLAHVKRVATLFKAGQAAPAAAAAAEHPALASVAMPMSDDAPPAPGLEETQ